MKLERQPIEHLLHLCLRKTGDHLSISDHVIATYLVIHLEEIRRSCVGGGIIYDALYKAFPYSFTGEKGR